MKFVADENIDLPIIAGLRNDGHERSMLLLKRQRAFQMKKF